jgi:hypothetical protein
MRYKYIGKKFSAAEAEQIMRETHARLRQRYDESLRRQARDTGIVYKTRLNARLPERSNSTKVQ